MLSAMNFFSYFSLLVAVSFAWRQFAITIIFKEVGRLSLIKTTLSLVFFPCGWIISNYSGTSEIRHIQNEADEVSSNSFKFHSVLLLLFNLISRLSSSSFVLCQWRKRATDILNKNMRQQIKNMRNRMEISMTRKIFYYNNLWHLNFFYGASQASIRWWREGFLFFKSSF